MPMSHVLPSKLPQYLIRIQMAYSAKGNQLGEVLAHSRYLCVEDAAYDNWNGGMSGHDVIFFLPLDQLGKIDIDDQLEITNELKNKLNSCAQGIESEWYNDIRFELIDENDDDCQASTPFSPTPPVSPNSLEFWKPGLARIFISHRDAHKVAARELGEALESYGVACFVAHDTIKPMKSWRNEILKGLQTMEVMLIFLTDDFQDSWYCHQEVGYALGRGVPIISLKLGHSDPPGFISEVQAARGRSDTPIESARKLFPLIGASLGRQGRLQEVLVNNFVESPSYVDAKARFELMADQVKKLTDSQILTIKSAFRANDQLHYSGYLTSKYDRIRKFMEKTTDKEWEIDGKNLMEKAAPLDPLDLDDDVPF